MSEPYFYNAVYRQAEVELFKLWDNYEQHVIKNGRQWVTEQENKIIEGTYMWTHIEQKRTDYLTGKNRSFADLGISSGEYHYG